jgi:hypothetical protein
MTTFLVWLSGGLSLFLILTGVALWRIRTAKKKAPAAPAAAQQAAASYPVEEKKHPCAVMHAFEVVATKHLQLACMHTSVLYKCRGCHSFRTDVFPGDFTLADFTVKVNIEDLERLVKE